MSNWFFRRDPSSHAAKSVTHPLFRHLCVAGILAATFLAGPLCAAGRWQMQYFYDEDKSSLTINDLAFPSAQRGVAVGFLSEENKLRPTAVVTSDGGAHWSLVPTKEAGISLFFLNESLGWMVTQKGLWQTEEAGRNWHKLSGTPKELLRVHFLDEQRGFAVGLQKGVYQTTDGAKTWTRVESAAKPETNPKYTVYTTIQFVGKEVGMITGWSQPPRRDEDGGPDWLDPQKVLTRREWPHISISLDTRDGGKTWVPSTTSMFGRISRVRMLPNGLGLGLIEFAEAFTYPSEIFRFDMKTGKSQRAFREKNRAVTDVLLQADGSAVLAAVEVPGRVRVSSVPNKLKLLRTANVATATDTVPWQEMEVDYRAAARRAVLAGTDAANMWVATDTGMILKLVP